MPVSVLKFLWKFCNRELHFNCDIMRVREVFVYIQGYIFGGLIAGPLGWRAAFLIEAAAMVPFVLFCALAPPLNLKGMDTGVCPSV